VGDGVRVPLRDDSPWYRAAAAAGRWLVYVGLALMVGAVVTGWSIFGGRLPRGGAGALRAAVAAAAVGLALITAAQRAAIGAESLLPLFQTRTGELLLALGACLAGCAVAVVLADFWPARWSLALVGATAASAALVHAWSGHASTSALWAPLGIAVHWVHVLAIGAWVGGLAWLLLGLRDREGPPLGTAARAFSRVATVALAVAVATGLVRAATELGSPAALATSQYGAGLLAKLSFVGVLVALGAVSHYRLVPGLAAGDAAPGAFRLNSRAEVALAAAVLATTAVLTGLAPPA
jgi:copper transport protein